MMVSQTFKQTRLTPGCTSFLFAGDVFDMKGGKYENQDLRVFFQPYLDVPEAELLLTNKPKDDKFGGFQTLMLISRTKEQPVTLYNPVGLIEEGHPLTLQQGHKTVSSFKDANRLWNGKFVIEYDLVDCDKRGKKYLFMDGASLLEATSVRKDNEDDSYLDDALGTDDEEFVSTVKRKIDPEILNADKGPIVSGSTLLTEIKMLAELFKEETESEEKAGGLDPVMRKLLLPEGFPKDKPMFDVAFLTNVMMMGFKAVFYPTALEELSSFSEGADVVKLNALLAAQTELLLTAMPRIVASVNRTLSKNKCVKYFKIDVGGTKNLSLPANVKPDELAMPYHQFKIHENGVVEISNKELVTSLGVKKRPLAEEWLNELGVFERKYKYAVSIGRGGDKLDNNEWRRKLLFSRIADTLPFRYRTEFIDLDYYVSGLCFSFLNSEYGMSIDYDPEFVTSVINHTGGRMTTDVSGYSSEVATEGSSSTTATTAFLASNDIARSNAPSNPLPLPSDAPRRIYESLLDSDVLYKVLPLLQKSRDELGMIIVESSEEYASVIIKLLTTKTKKERKNIMENIFKRKIPLLWSVIDQRIVDTSGESEYYMAVAYSILQMVIRHIIRDQGIVFGSPEFNQTLSNMKWIKLDLDYLWRCLYMESINKPSSEMDEATAAKYAKAGQEVGTSVKDDDRLMEIINEINDIGETDEIVALRNKTVETIGDGHDCYPFASSAYGHDTMFLWTVVTLAERFCQLYNAVNNPEEYYRAMVSEKNKLSFEGGEENFKKLCSILKSELQIFMCGSDREHTFVCRRCVEKSERDFETKKNRVNKELFLIKKKELEMTMPSSTSVPIPRERMTSEEVYRYKADTDKLCRDIFDEILEVEAEADREEEEEECSSDYENYESCGEDDAFLDEEHRFDKGTVMKVERKVVPERLKEDVINGFFNRYAEVKSFRNRSALCHRQKYISINSLLVMDKLLSGYVVTPKIVKYQDVHARILEEVRSRSKRGKGWVIPYTFPVDRLRESSCCKGEVKLLVVPDSSSLHQLTIALRFNTMACERRFFTDVSTSLGFVPQADVHPQSITSPSSFFFNTDSSKYCDFYENIIKVQEDLRSCLLPRFKARYAAETYESSMKNLEEHASFFAGLWAICAKANLENTVLSAVVSCPQEASYTLKGNSDTVNSDSMAEHVARAVEAIGNRKHISIVKTFLEFAGCVNLVSMAKRTTVEADENFFLKLFNTYNRTNDCNGTHLWTLFSAMKRCFDNSLPLDWRKLLKNNRHLNLVPNAPNTDESGALFETARFISRCSELILGKTRKRLKECITREEWQDLLTGNGWSSRIALVYEKVMNTNDSRTTENFINSSTFLSNNNVLKKISINETENEKIRQACWSIDESSLSVDERIDLLMAVERTNRDMTLSTVMICCALYSLLVEGCSVEDITNKESENVDRFIPFLKSLSIVTATWNSNGGSELNTSLEYNSDNLIEVCAKNGRFVDIENDPVFFYRFAAYTLGMLANNDQFFEDLTGIITESFDFNGVDTRNWNDFIEKHFLSVLLGRRAFLVSRPAAFIKRMVGSSNDEKNSSDSVRRLSKLVMVKAVDANDLTLSDLVLCCIEDDKEDFVVRSPEEYQNKFYRFGKKTVKETNAADSAMSSNACSNEQMSKKVKASRPQDVRVYFNKKSDVKAIERNEEEEVDLSYGLYTDTVEKAVIKPERGGDGAGSNAGSGGGDDSSQAGERKRMSRQRENDTKNFNGRTEDVYDHSSREDTSGTMSSFVAASNSTDGSAFMREKDVKFRKDVGFTEDDLIKANENIVRRARKLMRQDEIKVNICQMIDSMSEGLRIVCPFNSHDDPSLLGLSRTAANRVIDTVRTWNAIVACEVAVFKEECKEIEKSCTYDMKLVLCGDYTSEGINSGFGDEVHVFKTPLFDVVSAEGKRVEVKNTSRPKKKNYDEVPRDEDKNSHEPHKDTIRIVNMDMLGDIDAFKKYDDAYCQRYIGFGDGPQGNGILFKQRLQGDRILDPSLAAHFFSSNLIDPYKRSVVPRLMQHNVEHEGKVSLKRSVNASEKNGGGSEGGGGRKKGGDDRVNVYAFSSLNIIRTYSDLSRLKQCSNENNSSLISLYDNVSQEQQMKGVSDIITKEDVRIPIRRGTVNGEEDYASVNALWLCNSGIHPRDQIEMFKKMVFRNYNEVWLKIYSEAMNVFRKWGVLTKATIDRPFFSVKFTTMPVQVVDNTPPSSVLHSKFLPKDTLANRVSATNPMVRLREYYLRSVSMTSMERFRPLSNIDAEVLDRAILSREFMTSTYDDRGSFVTSKFTNAATFVFMPGTSIEGRDYRAKGYAKDEDFVGKEEMLCINSFNLCYGRIVSALRYGVFEDTTSKSLEGGRNRVLRLYDNDAMLSSKSGSVNIVGVPSEASKIKCDSVMKRAAKDTIKDSNHTTRVKHSLYGHLTAQYSAINDNYNARNILMSIRRVNRAAVENEATNDDDNKIKSDEEKNKGADDLSLRYILGRHKGYVFYADDFPSEQKHCNHLSLLKKCFRAIRDRNVNDFAIFPKEWLALSIVPEITRSARLASKIKSCIKIDRRIDVGADIKFSDLAPKKNKKDNNTNLRRSINRSDASVGFEKRGVSFLANPVVSMRWFLMRGHHLRLSCTNFGVALLSNFMGNRENKSTPMDVPPSAKSLATVFKMKTTRNSCVSMDNNRFFLIGGSYVLGGRLEGVNLITDMFVRCKLQTEKQIVHEALFDANVTAAFLATCMEGTAITRGVSMIEHISRLTNATVGDSKNKNFWSLSSPNNRKKEKTQSEYCHARDASLDVRSPSVCIDDDNYVFLRMLYSVVSEMDKKRDMTASKVDRHVAVAIKKSYAEVLNPKNGLPNMHSLFHLRSIMNFCGFVNGICTGDGEKAHHLMHTLSAVGINMTPKTVLVFIGVDGNNLKSSLVNIVKARWWDMYADLSADALVGKGDSSATDAKFAYVAGKKNIFIMEEVGYQGSIKEKKGRQSGVGGGGGDCVDASDDKMSSLDSINTRNIEAASSLWDRVYRRLKDNNMRMCELETTRDGSLRTFERKRLRDEEDGEEENEREEATVEEFDKDEEAVSSTKKRTNVRKKNDKTPMINMFSNKVGWWSHIKGPVFSEIDRDKAISCMISNSEIPFCTSSENIMDNSPWVRETDSILVNHRDIESKLALYTPIPMPPGVVGKRAETDVEEDMDNLDLLSASASSSSSSCPLSSNASKIKEGCLNLIRKESSGSSFRTFSKMKELLMSIGYNQDNEWFIDENKHVLTPRRMTAGEAASNATKTVTCPAIFAMHAFSPSNYSQGIIKGFRRNYLDVPGKNVSKGIGSYLSKPRRAAKAMFSNLQLKQTVEQTIAHIIHFPSKYSFPVMTVDGSELFPIKPEASSRIVERFIRLNKTNLRGGRICKEIAAMSELASSISNNGQQELFSSVFLSPDSFDKGIHETNGTDVNFLDLMRNTRSHNKLNVIERTFAAALENCDNSKTGSNVIQESNLASSKMNRGSPFTEEMLPGQVSSNLVKQVASTDSIMSVRGLHGRPITCSVSATPVMISNSFLLRYYVDTAMYKRMLIFPFDTNFAPRNVEPNVELGDKIIRSGLKVIHASLLCERSNRWSINDNKKYVSVLKERLDEWNDLTGCCYDLGQVNSLVSMFPSVLLKHVMKTKVLELSDNSNLIKLEEACNTFFQSHASIMLSSRPNTLLKSKKREEEAFDDDEQAPSHKQICTINSKTMDTLQACIDRAKSGGVWGLVNSALRSVIFVSAPFVDTKVLYGEGCTVKMMLDEETSPTINMSSGLRLPDSDGIGRNGTVGVGDALMKQLVGSWGTTNIKNSMYSCHHLHTMFELVLQETTVQKRLKHVGDMASDYMSNVAFLLISSVYIEMFERFGVFANNGGSGAKRMRLDASAEEDTGDSSSYPIFMSMIVNKSIGHLNSMTNLADVKEKNVDNGYHTKKIAQVLSVLGKRLNTMYLCPSCKGKT